MADIFLSFAREDTDLAQGLANGLEKHGLDVFWDRIVPPGETWKDFIGEALSRSTVVIVLWSQYSVNSDWVQAEAQEASDQDKLIPVLIEHVSVPLGFRSIQHLDFSEWDGSLTDPSFQELVRSVAHITDQVAAPRLPLPDSPGDRVIVAAGQAYEVLRDASRIRVFIAHATADKPKLAPVVTALVDQGFQLWIDKPQGIGLSRSYESRLAYDRIYYGHDWRESIRLAVKKANAVLAFWSQDAVRGRREQFHYEVYMAMMQKKLSQCRIDRVKIDEIGMPYTFDHIADLADIEGGKYHPDLDFLMQDIVRRHRPRRWWSARTV